MLVVSLIVMTLLIVGLLFVYVRVLVLSLCVMIMVLLLVRLLFAGCGVRVADSDIAVGGVVGNDGSGFDGDVTVDDADVDVDSVVGSCTVLMSYVYPHVRM